jgi:tetratricopeptide (TPR) repeat protein
VGRALRPAAADIFALQDEIVRRIVTTLQVQLNLAQQGIVIPRSTENLEAYDDELRGWEYHIAVTRDGNAKARQMFEKALALDPKYAMAYAALGENYLFALLMANTPDPSSAARALKLEQQAIALDDSLAHAHSILGYIYLRVGQSDRALAEAERGVALDPNSGGYLWLAQVLIELGKPTEALSAISKAMRLDPPNTDLYLFQQGGAYTQLGLWHEAISSLKPHEAHYPGNLWSHVNLARDYAALGDKDAAEAELAEVERVVTLEPNSALGYFALADSLNSMGRPAQALAAMEKAMRLAPNERAFEGEQGWALSQLGRWQDSISSLNRLPASNSSSLWPHVWRAVDYVELGRDDAARAEVAEVLKINPQFSPKIGIAAFPANKERAAADLHKAGLN